MSLVNTSEVLKDIGANPSAHGKIVKRGDAYYYVPKAKRGDVVITLEKMIDRFVTRNLTPA